MCMHKHACSHVHIQVATVPRPWNKVCRRPIFVRNHAKFNNFGCDNQQTKTMMESKKKTKQNKKQSKAEKYPSLNPTIATAPAPAAAATVATVVPTFATAVVGALMGMNDTL